jgi:hypothetical protein
MQKECAHNAYSNSGSIRINPNPKKVMKTLNKVIVLVLASCGAFAASLSAQAVNAARPAIRPAVRPAITRPVTPVPSRPVPVRPVDRVDRRDRDHLHDRIEAARIKAARIKAAREAAAANRRRR